MDKRDSGKEYSRCEWKNGESAIGRLRGVEKLGFRRFFQSQRFFLEIRFS